MCDETVIILAHIEIFKCVIIQSAFITRHGCLVRLFNGNMVNYFIMLWLYYVKMVVYNVMMVLIYCDFYSWRSMLVGTQTIS